MARKTISLTGELHMNATGFSVTVDALETLKIVGIAYGVYDHAEDLRDCRVTLENGERPALVVQEDVSLHGSPFWETVRTITDDPERIRQYVAFRETKNASQTRRISSRHKKYGWKTYALLLEFSNNKAYERIFAEDPFMQMFLSMIRSISLLWSEMFSCGHSSRIVVCVQAAVHAHSKR